MQHQVLIYGHDQILLRTRELILRGAGYEVCIAEELAEAREILSSRPIDLLILCHSVDEFERSKLLAFAHACQKNLSTLLLATCVGSYPLSADETVFGTLEGPRNFILTVCRLTHEAPPASIASNSSYTGQQPCPDLQVQ
jgi:hypothetical protein